MKSSRVMIAAVKSGSGKTTITAALLQELLKRRKKVISFKCGPDYIDPLFHEKILQIPCRNLDAYFLTPEQLQEIFKVDQSGQEIAVIEGVMGLYDGLGGICEEGSSYHIAKILRTPIILVVDARGMGRSVISLIAGFLQDDSAHLIKGVILNQTSEMFTQMIRPEIEKRLGIRVYGCLPKQKNLKLESRHLGLVLPEELQALDETLEKAGALLEEHVEINEIIKLAEKAEELPISENSDHLDIEGRVVDNKKIEAAKSIMSKSGNHVRIAIARDEAFCFYYEDNLRILRNLGAQLVTFSPIHDRKLPTNVQGLILGGGYPELYAKELSDNQEMRERIKNAIGSGIPSLAECGGFMYLHEHLITESGKRYPMVGVIPAETAYMGKAVRFGYMELTEHQPCFLPQGTGIRGHEFHYFDSTSNGSDCISRKPVTGRQWACVHENRNSFWGFPHLYYASNPAFAEHFVSECMKK